MPERCPRCRSTHDSLDGVAVHLWKSQDDDHADVTSKDEGMRVAVSEAYSNDDNPPADGDSEPPDDDGATDSSGDSGDPTLSDGPPDVPDDPDPETVEAPCGHEFETEQMADGRKYRCSDCDVAFTYHE